MKKLLITSALLLALSSVANAFQGGVSFTRQGEISGLSVQVMDGRISYLESNSILGKCTDTEANWDKITQVNVSYSPSIELVNAGKFSLNIIPQIGINNKNIEHMHQNQHKDANNNVVLDGTTIHSHDTVTELSHGLSLQVDFQPEEKIHFTYSIGGVDNTKLEGYKLEASIGFSLEF